MAKEKEFDAEFGIFKSKMFTLGYRDIDERNWEILYNNRFFIEAYKQFYHLYEEFENKLEVPRIKLMQAERLLNECEPIAREKGYKIKEVEACKEIFATIKERFDTEKRFKDDVFAVVAQQCYLMAYSLQVAKEADKQKTPESKKKVAKAKEIFCDAMAKLEKDTTDFNSVLAERSASLHDRIGNNAHIVEEVAEDLYGFIVPPKPRTKQHGTELSGETLRKLKEEASKAYQNGKDTKVEEEYTRLGEALNKIVSDVESIRTETLDTDHNVNI